MTETLRERSNAVSPAPTLEIVMTYREAWHYIYGSGSHMSIAGKLFLGAPMFPFVFVFVTTWILLDSLFSKREKSAPIGAKIGD